MISKLFGQIIKHKIIAGLVALVVIGGGYYGYKTFFSATSETRYVLGTVEKTTIIASISASGQVSTSDQIDVKPKAAGDITWVGVKAGDTVRAGQALAYIDATKAKQAVADAEASLLQAKLQYQKDSAQAPIDYEKSVETLDDAKAALTTTYNDTYNTISNAYLDLPNAVTGMQNILYGYDLSQSKNQWNIDTFRNRTTDSGSAIKTFADIAERDYKIARAKYDQSVLDYKTLTRSSPSGELEKFLSSSIDTTMAIAQALQSELNLLDAAVDDATTKGKTINPVITTMRTNARSYLGTANSNLSTLLNQQRSLDSVKKTIRDNERNIEIYKIGNPDGANPISLQSSAQNIANQERNLQEQKNDLANYTISAPFPGIVASLNLKRFDTVSTGSSVATLITNQKIATLSLNEVDAAKISIGDKATLTFDAIEDFMLTGEIAEIDSIGTVAQGVVSYKVKVAFDSQDERIKSGMSANASIQTDVRQNVLAVPSSAVKMQNGVNYVQVFDPELISTGGAQGTVSSVAPKQIEVTVGISDDSNVEILAGLNEGRQIVTRTISGTAATTQTTTATQRGGFGGGGIRF